MGEGLFCFDGRRMEPQQWEEKTAGKYDRSIWNRTLWRILPWDIHGMNSSRLTVL